MLTYLLDTYTQMLLCLSGSHELSIFQSPQPSLWNSLQLKMAQLLPAPRIPPSGTHAQTAQSREILKMAELRISCLVGLFELKSKQVAHFVSFFFLHL